MPGATSSRNTRQRGQAMVEVAIALPILLFILLAVAFLGQGVLERQQALTAARYAAREAAMLATARGLRDKLAGEGLVQMARSGSKVQPAAAKALGAGRAVTIEAPGWSFEPDVRRQALGKVTPLGRHGHVYTARSGDGRFGVGFVLLGERVVSRPALLDWLGRGVNEGSQLLTGRRGSLWKGPGLAAEAYMPGELPVRGAGNQGLMELNPWIRQILEEPVP